MERLTRKAEAGKLDDPEFQTKINELARPWAQARIAEGETNQLQMLGPILLEKRGPVRLSLRQTTSL